ncbi:MULTISPECIES: heparin lyase I family protein [Paraburkholderia]|uniref:heparin lyase I family protein n=1 Tax=Paraburkholderia TaxID=1822464 RepID=UPI0013586961|nr:MULTISPECIES: heparin lyase I family protein [Paraburkholderia]
MDKAWLAAIFLLVTPCTVLADASGTPGFDVLFSSAWGHGVDSKIQYQMPNRDSIQVVDLANSAMPHALKVTISRDENYENVANGVPRAEISFGEYIKFHRNEEYFVRWQTYIPGNYKFDKKQPEVIMQIHQGAQIHWGYPTFALFFSTDTGYGVRSRTGQSTDSVGKIFGSPEADRGRVVDWTLRYIPDDTGENAVTELLKDGGVVFQTRGVPNAYPGDDAAYLKFGLYKAGWKTKPTDVDIRTMYFGRVSILRRNSSNLNR